MAVSKSKVGLGRRMSNQMVGNKKTGGSMLPFQNNASMKAAYNSGKGIVASASGIKRAGSTADNILLASSVFPVEAVIGKALGAVGKVAARTFPKAAKTATAAELRIGAAANRIAGRSKGLVRAGELQADYLAQQGNGLSEMARAYRGVETGWGTGAEGVMARSVARAAKTATTDAATAAIKKRLAALRGARKAR